MSVGYVASSFVAKAVISSLTLFSLLTTPSVELTKPLQYDSFSTTYDVLNGGSVTAALGIDGMRDLAAAFVAGDVLEVAVGTGLQSQYYRWPQITSFSGVDMSEGMLREASERIPALVSKSNSKIPIELRRMNSNKLDYDDGKFDTVVDTFSMCVFDDPLQAIKEMNRVLKPSGRVVLVENSVSTNSLLANIQDVTEPIITPYSKGCRWNVNIPKLANQAGLKLVEGKDIQLGTIMYGVYSKTDE